MNQLARRTSSAATSLNDNTSPRRRFTRKMNWHTKHTDALTRGERAADRLRNYMGSWMFIGIFVTAMGVWAIINATRAAWDPYPFILLNLFLSMLAGLQGAILLIAAKRQDAIAAALAQHDFETDAAAKSEIEELLEINERQLALIELLIEDRAPADDPRATAVPTR